MEKGGEDVVIFGWGSVGGVGGYRRAGSCLVGWGYGGGFIVFFLIRKLS